MGDWYSTNAEHPGTSHGDGIALVSVGDVVCEGDSARRWIVTGFNQAADGVVYARLSPYGREAWAASPCTVPVDRLTVTDYADPIPYSTQEPTC